MDKLNKEWLKGIPNFYFRYKYKVVENLIEGTCLNIGCGEHYIIGALNIDYPEYDATTLPFKDNSFDTVLLCDVLEHLSIIDRNRAFNNAYHIANKKVIVTLPAFKCLWGKYDEILGHYKRYSKRDLFIMYMRGKSRYLFGALFPFIYLRKFSSGKTPNLPKWVDTVFYWLSHIRLPFGSTLLVEVTKL